MLLLLENGNRGKPVQQVAKKKKWRGYGRVIFFRKRRVSGLGEFNLDSASKPVCESEPDPADQEVEGEFLSAPAWPGLAGAIRIAPGRFFVSRIESGTQLAIVQSASPYSISIVR